MTLIMKMSIEVAIVNAPIVESRFQRSHPWPSEYVEMRRGMPRSPEMCIGKKVRLKPMSISQKWIWPKRSSSSLPVNFGSQ